MTVMRRPRSRRRLLETLIRYGGVAAVLHGVGGALRGAVAAAPDDAAWLQVALDKGDIVIRRRPQDYRLVRPLLVPAGRTVAIEPGVVLRYVGPGGTMDRPCGVLEVDRAADVKIAVTGPGECRVIGSGDPTVYAVVARGVRNLAVTGLRGRDCNHVLVTGSETSWPAVVTSGAHANVSRKISIRGGGADFTSPVRSGHGACALHYAYDWTVTDCDYFNVAHGVQWWGGDANPERDGKATAERKCANFVIANVTVRAVNGGGIWGSMGQSGHIADCTVEGSGDVGFDAEGSRDIRFDRCRADDCVGGCFATFYTCDAIVFADCRGLTRDPAWPLFRSYNASLDNSMGAAVAIVGGSFACTAAKRPGTIDSRGGPPRRLSITGARLDGVSIDTAHPNMHDVIVRDVQMSFAPTMRDFVAIDAGHTTALVGTQPPLPGRLTIADNRIDTSVGATAAIRVVETDFNSSAIVVIASNRVAKGYCSALTVENGSSNPGIVPVVTVEDNVFAATTVIKIMAKRLRLTWRRNRDLAGRSVQPN